ncbi:MAG: hypothetical protein SFT92_00935 [Rickettsiales bacterium]|nr:hypothetical protein [Rickettsiales bacterium]
MIRILLATLSFCLIADMASAMEETQYVRDKEYAIGHAKQALQKQCLAQAVSKAKNTIKIQPTGSLAFSDDISREVYQTFYWDNADRGVAFVLPVVVQNDKGQTNTNIACFYALTNQGLKLQMAKQVAVQP